MNRQVKKWHIIGTIFIIVIGTLLHFVYQWSGENDFVGIFGAVNESTWEHLKLLFWPALIFSIIEYFYIGKKYDNYITAKVIGIYLGIFLIITIFYTYTGIIGDNYLVMDILVFVISVVISQYVSYKIILSTNPVYKKLTNLSIILLVLLTCLFIIFSFNPPQINLFKDPLTGDYGMK